MNNHPLTVALIGAGNIATRHLANLQFLGDNRVVAICDLDRDRAAALAGQCGANVYTDWQTMVAQEPQLDALILCTPPTVRRALFTLAAEHKLAVYCEKPPANTLDEAHKIAHIVQESGMICSVGFHMRYSPAVDRFRTLTAGRPVNLVQSIMASPAALTRSLDSWFFIQEKSGGPVMDQAIHVIDLLRFVVGDITQVQTFGNNVLCPQAADFTIEDSTCTNLRFANGASGSHIHSWAVPKGMDMLTILGADFSLALRPHSPPRVQGIVGWPGTAQTVIDETFPQGPPMGRSGRIPDNRRPTDPPDPPHCEALKVFLAAVRSGDAGQIRSPYADAVQSLAVVLAMLHSSATGAVEAVPMKANG